MAIAVLMLFFSDTSTRKRKGQQGLAENSPRHLPYFTTNHIRNIHFCISARAYGTLRWLGSKSILSGFSYHCTGPWRTVCNIILSIPLLTRTRYWSALVRGIKCKCPCPKCNCPSCRQHFLLEEFKLRTAEDVKAIYDECSRLYEEGEYDKAEKILQFHGLYYVRVCHLGYIDMLFWFLCQNVWWEICNMDVYRALSYDVLHLLWLGLWGKHLWPLLLKCLDAKQKQELNRRACNLPAYPDLPRFTRISSIDFNDGKKFFAILQVCRRIANWFVHSW